MVTLATSYPFLNIVWPRIRGFNDLSKHTVGVHRLDKARSVRKQSPRYSLGIAPMVVIRSKDVASHRDRHAARSVLAAGRTVLSAGATSTVIAPDSNGRGLRIAPRRVTTCRPSASRGLAKPCRPVGAMTRAACDRGIADQPRRSRAQVPPC
jgi:hypothetical protein